MRRVKKPSAFLVAALLLLAVPFVSTCSPAQLPTQTEACTDNAFAPVQEQIAQMASAEMKRNQITGLSVALVGADGIIFTINLGYADLENKVPVTSDTLFKVGSVSKVFTATAIMQLAEQGKIDIDKPLKEYIPEFSVKTRFTDADPITIRSLMTHRSGLPGNDLPEVMNPKYPYFTNIVDDIKQEYAAYPPNHITAYSNIGSVLLGVVVERVSGQKFDEYMTDHILKPLAMDHSSFAIRKEMLPLLSKGYRKHHPAVDDICPDGINPEGSLRSSVFEMSRFMQMVLNKGAYGDQQIIKETTLNQMLTPQPRLPLDLEGNGLDATGSIGLNWFIYEDPYCGKIITHPGGTRLFFSKMTILTDAGLGVVVLDNSANGEAVVNQIATETLVAAIKAKNAFRNPPDETKRAALEIELEPLEGTFATSMGWMIVERSEMRMRKYPHVVFKLTEMTDGWTACKPFFWGVFPMKIPDMENLRLGTGEISGEQVLLANDNGILRILGEKIEVTPIPKIWRKRCGLYAETDNNSLDSLNYKMRLQVDRGMLMAHLINEKGEQSEPYLVTPVSNTELLIRGLGRNMHEIIRVVESNGEEKLSYEGLLFKK